MGNLLHRDDENEIIEISAKGVPLKGIQLLYAELNNDTVTLTRFISYCPAAHFLLSSEEARDLATIIQQHHQRLKEHSPS